MTDRPAHKSAIERQLRYQARRLIESRLRRLEQIDPRLRVAAEADIGHPRDADILDWLNLRSRLHEVADRMTPDGRHNIRQIVADIWREDMEDENA